MPCSSSQYPPSPMDRNENFSEIKSELELRKTEIRYLSEKFIELRIRMDKLEQEYKPLLNFYQLMGNGG